MVFPGLKENVLQTVVHGGGVGELRTRAACVAQTKEFSAQTRLEARRLSLGNDEVLLSLFFESLGDLAPKPLQGVSSIVRTPIEEG